MRGTTKVEITRVAAHSSLRPFVHDTFDGAWDGAVYLQRAIRALPQKGTVVTELQKKGSRKDR
eukprot:CAMPEP_0174296656 /NCGR_PEP_ID=MMETSP0809-20121228/48518_1 /TAXON_ID=73025 ORGANISM="Eutreptiella gymnastica-like, Strain CCMP1594" /NCGR_SAMPLE_ID=MMETSP0809 /ASSEMBLY_ACC=CAM_ASM_000658 /LENGTH=62 /DNA_ID=CAMNT_0015399813 /DNA_START=135 /DNA_END=320 /DNA_ORIENTATION=-